MIGTEGQSDFGRRLAPLTIALSGAIFTLVATTSAYAASASGDDLPKSWAALANDSEVRAADAPKPDFSSEIEARKSYLIPALDIIGFDILLNEINRHSADSSDYKSNLHTIRRNLRSSWGVDSDPFRSNQLGHLRQLRPYRSANLSRVEHRAIGRHDRAMVVVRYDRAAGHGTRRHRLCRGRDDRSTADNDYHYGLAPQAVVALRLIFGERASLDLTGREYFVSRLGAATRGGHDNIARLDASFTVRVYKRHGVAVSYLLNRRDAFYPDVGDSSQTRGTVGLFYTFLGHERFGAVDWR